MERRPHVIALGGPGSNSGKTGLACRLIAALAGRGMRVAALKIATATPDHRCARTGLPCTCLEFEGRMRLLLDECSEATPGKDTDRMRAAGALPVWFLQTTSDVADESARSVLSRDVDADVLVVEGAAPVRLGLAHTAIAVGYADGRSAKEGWLEMAARADVVVLNDKLGAAAVASREAELRSAGLPEDARISVCDPEAESPVLAGVVDAVCGRVSRDRVSGP